MAGSQWTHAPLCPPPRGQRCGYTRLEGGDIGYFRLESALVKRATNPGCISQVMGKKKRDPVVLLGGVGAVRGRCPTKRSFHLSI